MRAAGCALVRVGSEPIQEVFTSGERRFRATKSPEGRAGRLAAKRAVAQLLGVDAPDVEFLRSIEIIPRAEGQCFSPHQCERGHPPTVTLHGPSAAPAGGSQVVVSITHTRDVAVAVAVSFAKGGSR